MIKKMKLSTTKKHIIELCVALFLFFVISSILVFVLPYLMSICVSMLTSAVFSDDIVEYFTE